MAPWDCTNIQKSRQMAAAMEGKSRTGTGLWIDSHVPSSARKGSSKLALVSLALLFPQGRRGKVLLQCDPASLGDDSVCYAPETP